MQYIVYGSVNVNLGISEDAENTCVKPKLDIIIFERV